jgi:hypothetical protein
MKYMVSGLIVVLLGLASLLAYYLGAFLPVEFTEKQLPPFHIVYKAHIGPYHKIVPTLDEVAKMVASYGETCERSFGEFLDNPKEVEEDRLQAHVGCIVEKEITDLPGGYSYGLINHRNYLVSTFYGSPAIGPLKVYPKAQKILAERPQDSAGPPIEIYRIIDAGSNKMETTYLFPLNSP